MGALPGLKIGDLELITGGAAGAVAGSNFQLYQITVYQGYNEEYITFCTPECTKAIESYLKYRERSGEKFTDDSPLIREQFNPNESFKAKYARPISIQTITKTLKLYLFFNNYNDERRFIQSGLRTVIHTGDHTGSKMRNRKDVPLIHGFRKFFNTALMNADVHPVIKELLMGHSLKLDDFYYDKASNIVVEHLIE